MDLVTQTSLEALLLKATNPQNQNIDTAAVEAFTTLINKEKDGAHIGVKVISARLPSGNEREVLQTLNVLDVCMSKCGVHFQNEVGKFRFLNEMIKLVSPKYLGAHTPLAVKQKVLQLMYVWTLDYPKEIKIKEAFDMLRKQGVIRDIPNPNIALDTSNISKKPVNSIFYDDEKSKILQKLLQSKDPEDIQAANWLIKSMVKEDDKRAEIRSKRISELESVQNNVRLLNEMLDSYKPGSQELDLIKELYQSCERFKPNILKIAHDSHQSEEMLVEIFETSDELRQVLHKYQKIIVKGKVPGSNVTALLEFDSSDSSVDSIEAIPNQTKTETSEVLHDILTSSDVPDAAGDVLQPVQLPRTESKSKESKADKFSALEDLDLLSEQLIKENLGKQGNYKNLDKVPMNLLTKNNETKVENIEKVTSKLEGLDLSYLVNQTRDSLYKAKQETLNTSQEDDLLVDIMDEKLLESHDIEQIEQLNGDKQETNGTLSPQSQKSDINLKDICVKLESIKPSNLAPIPVFTERNGVSVTLHFAKDKPKEDVSVYVITTISKNNLPLTNYLCQAIVPKGCKIKLQAPSSNSLPAFNPFLPPAAISQVILLANPSKLEASIKFIISYVMDEENVTEMGEVEKLPVVD